MKKLLSLPPHLVDYFQTIEKTEPQEWFCGADPAGSHLGSGGGTVWLLESCRRKEMPEASFAAWLSREKRILLHAGGQSRRLPAYAPSGKILTPIPVFRWARGQRLSQNLLSLQTPLYEEIMQKAPASLHTLVASGDVYIRHTKPLQDIPEADVVCYGLWTEPSLATRHGVFLSNRKTPGVLDFMLQKPSLEKLGELAGSHLFLMDIGVWLLSDRAMELLYKRTMSVDGNSVYPYDLYGTFGLALGEHPTLEDPALKELTVAVLPLEGGEFYHYGTSRELISSTLAIQNLVNDQRLIMQRKIKPHPALFVQNADMNYRLTEENAEVWIENSCIGSQWRLHKKHIITGVPRNDWQLKLPEGVCVDVVPIGAEDYVARPYGFADTFSGKTTDRNTLFMGKSIETWAKERGIELPVCDDIQQALLFPCCQTVEKMGIVLRWMIAEPTHDEGKEIWLKAKKLAASDLTGQANLPRLIAQRKEYRKKDWAILAENHNRSVFYQLDLADAAEAYAAEHIPLPPPLDNNSSLLKEMNDLMFRARVKQLTGQPHHAEEQQAYKALQKGLTNALPSPRQQPRLSVFQDQIVWGRSPVRIDLAGGWTDTPPFCLYEGGSVVNVAIELNGQPPLQVYVKPSQEYRIILRSIDLGAIEILSTWEELTHYTQVGSPFSIPKAALSLAGFAPAYATESFASLEEQLKNFGCGIEITLLAAIPAGSGLGTSSILTATVLGALSDFCGLNWDRNEIANRTLILEQMLTTGGGWQDAYGGTLHGLKLLQTNEGFLQSPMTHWMPEHLFTNPEYRPCHLLYYTGITRRAKDILSEIVRNMFLNSGPHLALLAEMKAHAGDMYQAVQRGDFDLFGNLVGKTWEQKKAIDPGTNPPAIEALIHKIKDYCLGYTLPGAGGGGYLYMVAKDADAAMRIQQTLSTTETHPNARFVDMQLSTKGLQISRS